MKYNNDEVVGLSSSTYLLVRPDRYQSGVNQDPTTRKNNRMNVTWISIQLIDVRLFKVNKQRAFWPILCTGSTDLQK